MNIDSESVTAMPSIQDCFSDGSAVDIWAFIRCEKYTGKTPIPFKSEDSRIIDDFNYTAFGAIIVSERMAVCLRDISPNDFELIPCLINNNYTSLIVNVLANPDCIDTAASIIQYYPPDDPEKPNKPRGVIKLVIDSAQASPHHILRPKYWQVEIVISQIFKDAFEQGKFTGMRFSPAY
ncbi:hypothetical protein KIH39_21260 [Telmatocola sphagniphila]|uniref:Immunity MXAN-0049 protein domain-containing protein n=1 Tax=Telmatocola sphagniphila TaxID=1123043 RepID=A0A8E6B376_9BACT|nr:DUF1629 domain-containing protein [Telmatocola sphagniphila]QVL31350.1 hypothetical protein KIH39_21260 [Telmatocola sphagniphila]